MNVLIVDDEKRISDFLMNFARSQGYTDVDTVASANEAMVQAMRQRYDLITLDLSMPDASGLEIIGMLRNMCPHAIIVIISGFLPETVTSEVAGSVDVILAKRHWFSDVEVFNSLRNKVLRSADLKKLGDRKPPL